MNFYDLAKSRYSVRTFENKKVAKEILDQILEVGNLAPTAKNSQPHRIYILESDNAINKIRSITKMAFDAPIVLIFTYLKSEQWNNPFCEGYHSGIQDVSIVATHMMLEASQLGLGTTWINYFDPIQIKEAFNINEDEEIVLLMPLGYPSVDSKPSNMHSIRKDIHDIVTKL